MTGSPRPTSATNCTNQYDDHRLHPADPDATVPWPVVLDHLSGAFLWWLTVPSPTGRPRVRPVFAVTTAGRLFTTSSGSAAKTRALARSAPSTLATSTNGLDVVWDGTPVSVEDPDEIALVAAAYRDHYDWPVTPGPAGLDAPYGAPAAGPPPYHVFRLEPESVHAFGTDGDLGPRSTRFEF